MISKFHFWFLGILLFIVGAFEYYILNITNWVDLSYKSISISFIIYGFCWLIFDHWLWRISIIIKIRGIPNLNGTWQGILKSSYKNIEKEVTIEIEQTFSIAIIKITTDEIESYSIISKWDKELANKPDDLFYIYKTIPNQDVKNINPAQYGAAKLKLNLKNKDSITIEYWTDRNTTGTIKLKRTSK